MMDDNQREKLGKDIRKLKEVHEHTRPEDYAPELVKAIAKAAHNSLAVWGVPFSELEVSYIRELAEHVYAVRFSYKTPSLEPFSTQGDGLYVHYFASSLYLGADTLARYVRNLLGERE